jgi:hypothetical protein
MQETKGGICLELNFEGKMVRVKELSYDEVLALPIGERVLYYSGDRGEEKLVSANVIEPQPVIEEHGGLVGKLKYGKEPFLGYANIWKSKGDNSGVFLELK